MCTCQSFVPFAFSLGQQNAEGGVVSTSKLLTSGHSDNWPQPAACKQPKYSAQSAEVGVGSAGKLLVRRHPTYD